MKRRLRESYRRASYPGDLAAVTRRVAWPDRTPPRWGWRRPVWAIATLALPATLGVAVWLTWAGDARRRPSTQPPGRVASQPVTPAPIAASLSPPGPPPNLPGLDRSGLRLGERPTPRLSRVHRLGITSLSPPSPPFSRSARDVQPDPSAS